MSKNLFRVLLPFAFLSVINFSCQKDRDRVVTQEESKAGENKLQGHLEQAKTFSSDVVTSWLNMQLSMLRVPLPAGTGSQASDRSQAYCGIAAYEAVVNGMPAYKSLSGQLTGFSGMPATENGKAYHWAAAANAALADMNRKLFPTTADANKTRMNFLEDSLNAIYANEVNAPTLQRSLHRKQKSDLLKKVEEVQELFHLPHLE